MSDMRILFISKTDPKKVSYGGQQRMHVLWKALMMAGEVTTIVPVPHCKLEYQDETNNIYGRCLEKRFTFSWVMQRLLAKVFPQFPVSWGTKMRLPEVLETCFDVVVVSTLQLFSRYKPNGLGPVIIDVDDTPVVDYSLAYPKNHIRKALLGLWQAKTARYAQLLWVPDENQKHDFSHSFIETLPNIPLVERIGTKHCKRKIDKFVLVFLGYLAHKPNQVALDWFLGKFWNDIKTKYPNLQLKVGGKGLPQQKRDSWEKFSGVSILGYIEDIHEFYNEGTAFIAPMQTGSGTCIKVLEALAYGLPVIATAQGFRGIAPKDRTTENALLEFEDLAGLMKNLELVQNADCDWDLRGQRYVREHYTQEVLNKIVYDGLHACIKAHE